MFKPSVFYILEGRIPSKKNNRRSFRSASTGRQMNLPSKDYLAWHKMASEQLKVAGIGKTIGHCVIDVNIIFGDKRRTDLSNKFESIADLLVDNSVIEDDSWQVVQYVSIHASYEKSRYGAIIEIKEYAE